MKLTSTLCALRSVCRFTLVGGGVGGLAAPAPQPLLELGAPVSTAVAGAYAVGN